MYKFEFPSCTTVHLHNTSERPLWIGGYLPYDDDVRLRPSLSVWDVFATDVVQQLEAA